MLSNEKKGKYIKDEKTIIQQQTQNSKISVIIPVYNEDPDTVSKVVSDILNGAGDELLEILVVDDGSEKFEFYYPDTRVKLLKKEHGGKGSAIKFGVEKAKGDILVFTDGDGELLVEWKDIENAVKLMEEKNVQAIFGVRRFKGSGSPLWHKFLNRALSFFVSFITLKWCPDVLCGFRIIKKNLWYEMENISHNGYGFETTFFLSFTKSDFGFSNLGIEYKTSQVERKHKNMYNILKGLGEYTYKIIATEKKQCEPYRLNNFLVVPVMVIISYFILLSFVKYPLSQIRPDDYVHLSRAKWTIFGERDILLTVTQSRNIVNYSWLFHLVIRQLGCKCNYTVSYEDNVETIGNMKLNSLYNSPFADETKKMNSRCILIFLLIKASLTLLLFYSSFLILTLRNPLNKPMDIIKAFFISFPLVFLSYFGNSVRILTYILLAATIYLTRTAKKTTKKHILIFLFQVLWVNIHISGFVLPLIYLLFSDENFLKRLFFTSFLLIGMLLNPHTIGYAQKIISSYKVIEESSMVVGELMTPLDIVVRLENSYLNTVHIITIIFIYFYSILPLRFTSLFMIFSFFLIPIRFYPIAAICNLTNLKITKISFLLSLFSFILLSSSYFILNKENITEANGLYEYYGKIANDDRCDKIFFVSPNHNDFIEFFYYPKLIPYNDSFFVWNNISGKLNLSELWSSKGNNCILMSKQYYEPHFIKKITKKDFLYEDTRYILVRVKDLLSKGFF